MLAPTVWRQLSHEDCGRLGDVFILAVTCGDISGCLILVCDREMMTVLFHIRIDRFLFQLNSKTWPQPMVKSGHIYNAALLYNLTSKRQLCPSSGTCPPDCLNFLQQYNRSLQSLLFGLFYVFACQDRGRDSAPRWACTNEKLGLVKLLIENGVSTPLRKYDMLLPDPILYATYSGHADIVSYLLERDTNSAAALGNSAVVYWAMRVGRVEVVRLVLDKGAVMGVRWDQMNKVLRTAVMQA